VRDMIPRPAVGVAALAGRHCKPHSPLHGIGYGYTTIVKEARHNPHANRSNTRRPRRLRGLS